MQIHPLYKAKFHLKNYIFMALIALELLMSFTFLGYIHIPPISITFTYIPIIIAGCFLGPAQSTILGFIFGLASMYKASSYYVMPFDKVFSPFFSNFPAGSILLNIGSRTLFGFLIGFIFILVKKTKHRHLWTDIIAAFAHKLHAFFIYTAMGLFFPELGYRYTNTFQIGIGDLLISLLCMGTIEALWRIIHQRSVQNFCSYVDQWSDTPYSRKYIFLLCSIFLFFTVCTAVASVFYFAQRISYMLEYYGLEISAYVEHDLLHLQIQFLIAAFSLNFIMVLSILILYKYLSCREYLVGLDGLTGVMGRKMFAQYCDTVQKSNLSFPASADEKNGLY